MSTDHHRLESYQPKLIAQCQLTGHGVACWACDVNLWFDGIETFQLKHIVDVNRCLSQSFTTCHCLHGRHRLRSNHASERRSWYRKSIKANWQRMLGSFSGFEVYLESCISFGCNEVWNIFAANSDNDLEISSASLTCIDTETNAFSNHSRFDVSHDDLLSWISFQQEWTSFNVPAICWQTNFHRMISNVNRFELYVVSVATQNFFNQYRNDSSSWSEDFSDRFDVWLNEKFEFFIYADLVECFESKNSSSWCDLKRLLSYVWWVDLHHKFLPCR